MIENFRNQSMQRRLIAAFMFMGFLVLIVAIFGLTGSNRLSTHINTLARNNLPSISSLWKINEGQTQIESSERALLNISLDRNQRQDEIDRMDNAWKQIEEGFEQYEATPKTAEETRAYDYFKTKWDEWDKSHKKFLEINQAFEKELDFNNPDRNLETLGKAREAYSKLEKQSEDIRPVFQAATDALLRVLEFNEALTTKTIEQSRDDVSNVGFWAFVAIAIGPGTAITLGIFFSNTIVRPLGAKIAGVVETAQKISAGDLTSEIYPSDQKDEIATLQNAFYTMNQDLNALIQRIQKSGIQIAQSANQIAASGKELEATVAEQLVSTNQVTNTSQQIAATSRDLVKTMEQVSVMSEQTAIAASNGQEGLTQIELVMRQLVEAAQLISAKLYIMNEKAHTIGRVVTSIAIVADQTNLLSLNAALEAEKAGEYGKGFSVVAREIRRLADQTAVSTLEIEQMIKEMQAAVTIGVREMDKFNESVVNSVAEVERIGEEISAVIARVQGLIPRFEQANYRVEEQSEGASQISNAMEQLSLTAQQTADSLAETSHALERLNQAAQELESEISRFKIMDRGSND
ncbi:MAG TPA: methyl-accepting chemotaxis protein [Cyanobacteria bacterium UBA11149]|nr:methyl-accepting chemotaxis protein [Cyanobacteria bacterium UBA11367]HBE56045.1 methyl-accepting chemotaxis protein [Cyanobacteria bacterium UBA11366]HBK63554.1 methyl-accepting chemotaxis protein [Cyanobacteria bacterium UBA11166]HBR73154.1 methyl-accepting chemotaxis protein [Cyanobacteria bacterium UBA11159]HBS70244.1 methyl-accepting chemotaxis protein [Cyanobacteria bacterium UBA11153]HBW89186.1 methyl-accepting chemotaxis protein [Cyanobacteria bacterium UBA11149]HCA94922.1 methyl-a